MLSDFNLFNLKKAINYARFFDVETSSTPSWLQTSKSAPEMSTNQNSTSSVAGHSSLATSSLTTDDTLSMITTPWTTESWESQYVSPPTNAYISWSSTDKMFVLSSLSFDPQSSSSSSPPSLDIRSDSRLTMTLYNNSSMDRGSPVLKPVEVMSSTTSSTFSSWTIESFTSDGRLLSDCSNSKLIKAYCRWSDSPYSLYSETDIYPSTFNSRSFILSSPSIHTESFDLSSVELQNDILVK
ncbi:unnamed protein product [Colias eurytheme]|nr:unnamed protein product [Colias eurytheme]